MSRRRKSNDLIRIEDAIKVLCRRVCHPGIFCPDEYCEEMWELLEDVERVDAVPVQRCKDRIIQEIDELNENGEAHSDDVRQNGLLIAEGLQRALRIIEEIFLKDGDHHEG